MGANLEAGFRPEFRVPDLRLQPVELQGGVVRQTIQPEKLMTPEQQQKMGEQLDALLRSKDFVHVDEINPQARARSLPRSDFEIVRKNDGKPLTHDGRIVIRNTKTREMFAVSSRNLQVNKADGEIHYTPSNFAADPQGAQAAAKASAAHAHDDPNAPHPVATVFQPKPTPETAAQKLAQEQALLQQQARQAAAKKADQVNMAASGSKPKQTEQSRQVRSEAHDESGRNVNTTTNFDASNVAAMAAANLGKVFTNSQQMKAASEKVEAETQQTGSIFAAVTAKQGTAQSNDQQQGRNDQGQRNAETLKTSEEIRRENTETVRAKVAAGGTPGRR